MQDIAEHTVLSRVTAELPDGLRIATEAFQEGWNFMRSGDVHRLDKAIRGCGWQSRLPLPPLSSWPCAA
jgi:hypothetical protein